MNHLGLKSTKNVAVIEYDVSRDGGAVGTVVPTPLKSIPKGAIITGGILDVETTFTSGGAATVGIHAETAGDVLAATAIAGLTAGTQVEIVGDIFKMADHGGITITVAVADLTAGAFTAYLEYIETR